MLELECQDGVMSYESAEGWIVGSTSQASVNLVSGARISFMWLHFSVVCSNRFENCVRDHRPCPVDSLIDNGEYIYIYNKIKGEQIESPDKLSAYSHFH